ncbi:MAG: hypothetical protein U0235_27835 [Polyangiaceae bacterium]
MIGHAIDPPMGCVEPGSEERKRTATCDGGSPDLGTGFQLATLGVPSGIRPNAVTSSFCPPRSTVMATSFAQLLAMNIAKHGWVTLGANAGVDTK